MAKYLNLIEVKESCRVCLERKFQLIPSISCIYLDNDGVLVKSTIQQILNIFNSQNNFFDEYPSGICLQCKHLVEAAFELKTKFETSTIILQELVRNKILSDNDCVENEIIPEEHDHTYTIPEDIQEDDNDIEFIVEEEPVNECINAYNSLYSSHVPNEQECIKAEIQEHKHYGETEIPAEVDRPQTQKQTLHQCPVCPLQCSALELKKHINTHKSLKTYLNIPKTNRPARFYASPRETVTLVNSGKEILHKCLHCDEELQVEEFCRHVSEHQEDEIKCDQCNRVFSRTSFLTIHQYYHKNDFPYKCDICQKGFILKSNFDCHMLTHTGEQLPYVCHCCQKRFANPVHLQRHSLIHTENISYNQKYGVKRCYTCLRCFKTLADLQNHKCQGAPLQFPLCKKKKYKSASGNLSNQSEARTRRIFKCKFCSKTYRTNSGLYVHTQVVHKGRNQRMLCSVCGEYVSNIKEHMMRHNGVKPYKCNICPKGFVTKPALRQHLFVHSGERPYICAGCGKTFNNLYNLQVHERIHTGVKQYLCSVCGKTFLEKSYLNKHLKVHKKLKYEIKLE